MYVQVNLRVKIVLYLPSKPGGPGSPRSPLGPLGPDLPGGPSKPGGPGIPMSPRFPFEPGMPKQKLNDRLMNAERNNVKFIYRVHLVDQEDNICGKE